MRRTTVTLSACAIGVALAAGPARAQAPIVTDGTMGARAELNGPAMQIPHTLGTQAGPNLFHSFQRFNIPTRNSATFTGPGGIDNVVSRVTGGEASTIDGAFRSTIPGADVWFTNPAGVTFGPNASLDVPASFHASTANEIRFPDGGRFSADLGATSTLSVAPPEAFGFLSSNPAPLKVERSQLSTVTDATLSLAAGEIDMTGGALQTPSGTINLASVAGPAEVKTDGTVSGNNHGAIRLTNGALVNASGDGAGTVRIRGGEVTSTGSYVLASNLGSLAGAGGIDISADRLNLQGGGGSPSLVAAHAHSAGDAVPINVHAPDINIENGSGIFNNTSAKGNAGTVSIEANDLTINNGSIQSSTEGSGKAGNIRIDVANQMTLDNFGFVRASSQTLDPAGAGGEITVHAGNLVIRGQAQIASFTRGPAPAGNIDVTAGTLLADSALAPGEQPQLATGITASALSSLNGQPTIPGKAGNINISAKEIRLTNGAEITSLTQGPGDAGIITLTVPGTLIVENAVIFNNTSAKGNAGTVSIEANDLTINNGSIQSSTEGSGKAGNIRIDVANQMTLDNFGFVRASSQTLDPAGAGGEITVHAGNLVIRGQAQIASFTRGPAPAGNIDVTAGTLLADSALAPGEQPQLATGITASALSSLNGQPTIPGKAGNINISAKEIRLTNGAEITSLTQGPGDAGIITLTVPGTLIVENAVIFNNTSAKGNAGTVSIEANDLTINNGSIQSSTEGSGKAGNIRIDVANQMTLDNFGFVRASSQTLDPAGAGGEITVHAGNLVIRGQAQIASFTIGPAPAGNINVTAGTLLADGPSTVQRLTGITAAAESELIDGQPTIPGKAGNINIRADDIRLTNGAEITSFTQGPGDAGIITLTVPGTLTIENGSGILNDTSAAGKAGRVSVHANILTLKGPNAHISSESFGSGEAGTIILTGVSELFMSDRAEVTTRSGSAGGGNIEISGDGIIVLRDGSRIRVDTEGGAQAGDITIGSRFLVLDRSAISADADAGSGGNIRVASDFIFRSPDSEITARAGPAGIAGTVVLTSPETDVTVDVAQLPGEVMNTAGQMQERCAVRGLVEGSSFTIAGLEALSPTLEGYLPGTYARVADEDTAVTDGSLMAASGGGLAFPVWTVACGDAG